MKPILIDRRTKVRDIISHAIKWLRWWGDRIHGTPHDQMMEIAGMNIDADPDEIDRMKGSPETWVRCDGCGRLVAAGAQVGAEQDDDKSATATLCRDCLIAALELLPEPVEVMPCSGS